MRRKFFACAISVACVGAMAGCSDSGSDKNSSPPTTAARTDWTPAGLTQAEATAAAIAKALPNTCTDAAPNDFSQFPMSMKQFHSKILPLAQLECAAEDETIEITVLADTAERDQYVNDRSTGVCDRLQAQAVKYKQPLRFPGLRWVVGDGNITVQPDSEDLARRIGSVTHGEYVLKPCAGAGDS